MYEDAAFILNTTAVSKKQRSLLQSPILLEMGEGIGVSREVYFPTKFSGETLWLCRSRGVDFPLSIQRGN